MGYLPRRKMAEKSVLAIITLGFLCHQFCHLQAVPVNNDDLASAFQSFSKKAAVEILAQRRHLEKIDQALGPLMEGFKNTTNLTESNAESFRVIQVYMQSLKSAVEANEKNLAEARMATSQCGGFISLDGEEELLYEIPRGVPSVNCIWVLWAKKGGPINIKNEPSSNAQFDSSFVLIAAQKFNKAGWQRAPLPSGSDQMRDTFYGFAVLFFQANVTKFGQGVHLKFEDTGAGTTTSSLLLNPRFKQLSLSQGNGTLKYPSGLSYEDDERVFAIGWVPQGKSLNVTFNRVDTELDFDWFRLMYLDSTLFSWKYSGRQASGTHLVPGGCSYIFIFFSDEHETRSGIQMSYNVSDNNIL